MSKQPLPYGVPHPPPGWPQKPAGISLCMIVKNEERFLEPCLKSVAGIVDEINIVDTGSTDGTLEIARRFGARIEHREWRDDFAWARNEALAMATRRWVLQLDADEVLEESSAAHVAAIKSIPAHLTGLLVRCKNIMNGAATNGTVNHAVTRIFPNHPRVRFRGRIHEYPALDNDISTIPSLPTDIRITHFGYLDAIVTERNKQERNMALLRTSIEEEPESAYHWYNLGLTAHIGGDQACAVDALERMWDICKRTGLRAFAGNALQILSTIYTEYLGKPERGLEYAVECLRIAPHYANAHFTAGKAYAALGEIAKAREMYFAALADAEYIERQYIVDVEACGWKPLCEIGTTYCSEGKHEDGLEWFDKALERRPDVALAHIRRAGALEALERFEEAEAIFHRLYLETRDEQAGLRYVNFLLRCNAPKAVETVDAEYRAFSPEVGAAILLAAAAVRQREGWDDGERQLLTARDLAPKMAQIHTALEELYRTREDFARAYEAARAALDAGSGNAVLRYNAAIDCVNLGLKLEALEHLRAIPADAAETGPRAGYLRAVLFRELERLDDALTSLDDVLARDPEQLDALLLRAAVLDASGRKVDAESAFRAALPLGARRAAIELAGFYLREGRPYDAKRVAEEALAS